MSDHVETTSVEESTEGVSGLQDVEVEWEALIEASPSMDRLPRMVADQYHEDVIDGPQSIDEFRADVAESVRLGLILLFRLLGGQFLDLMFEHFSLRFGIGVELLMEDIEFSYSNDHEVVEKYTPEQLCGRLFALLSMVIESRHREDTIETSTQIDFDEDTGFSLHMDPTSVLLILQHVVACAELGEKGTHACYAAAREVVLGYAFHLKQRSKQTKCH
jgi:hypothetical protein